MNGPKALHPVQVSGAWVAPGQSLDPAQVSETRLARMIAKGRVEGAPEIRAEETGGRPPLTLPKTGGAP